MYIFRAKALKVCTTTCETLPPNIFLVNAVSIEHLIIRVVALVVRTLLLLFFTCTFPQLDAEIKRSGNLFL